MSNDIEAMRAGVRGTGGPLSLTKGKMRCSTTSGETGEGAKGACTKAHL